MTDTLSSTQTWTQLANGAASAGSGIFGFTGPHKHKGASGHQAASTAGSVSDPSLSFNKLFANDLSANALSQTDPSSATAEQATDTAASAAAATSGSDENSALSGPLSPGLLAYLMGLNSPPASAPADGQAAADATTAAAGDDTTPAVQTATTTAMATDGQAGSAGTPDALEEILSELAELAGTPPADQTAAPSATQTTTAATDLPPADDSSSTVTDVAEADPAGSPAALQATALLEMQKALTAYLSGNLTNASATAAAATSIAI